MPKFKEGDLVVPVKTKFILNTKTHRNHSYTPPMEELMKNGTPILVSISSEKSVYAGQFSWHPDDLELYHLDLENK